MKIFQVLIISLYASFLTQSSQANTTDEAEAQAVMESELEILEKYINDENLDANAKRDLAEQQIRRRLSLKQMTYQSLGNHTSHLSDDEIARLSDEFQRHLIHCYLERIATLKDKSIEIVDTIANQENDEVVVRTLGGDCSQLSVLSRQSADKASVDYHLSKIENDWLITRIVVDGVDLNQNFRRQFESTLSRKEPAEIIASLDKKNLERENSNPFE